VKLISPPFKSNQSEAGKQEVFPNAVFGLPNGGNWAPNGMEKQAMVVVQKITRYP
jgi:predicted metalloprotease